MKWEKQILVQRSRGPNDPDFLYTAQIRWVFWNIEGFWRTVKPTHMDSVVKAEQGAEFLIKNLK